MNIHETETRPSKGGFRVHQPYEAKPLPQRTLQLKGISANTIKEHYKLYEGYVKKVNETRAKLRALPDPSEGNATYSEVRALKRGESYALDGAKLHELYFAELTPGGSGKPSKELAAAINTHFGSYERFLAHFKGAALSARGWAILAYDTHRNDLFLYITDDQHDGHVIESVPLLPLDVFEHAYYLDYGTKRAGYIDAFFNNLDWNAVNKRFTRASKSGGPKFRLFGS